MFRATDFRPLAVALAVGLGVTACNPAESRDAPEDTEAAVARTVPAGTSLTLTVDDDVASDSYEPGDTFTSTLGADVADVEGRPVLTAGTKARWTVTEVADPEEGGQALIAARLESVQVDDAWHPVDATITDAAMTPAEEDVQTVSTGAEAEALIAQVTGTAAASAMTTGSEAGAAGALLAVSNSTDAAHIDSGSRITVRLSDSLVLRRDTDDGSDGH